MQTKNSNSISININDDPEIQQGIRSTSQAHEQHCHSEMNGSACALSSPLPQAMAEMMPENTVRRNTISSNTPTHCDAQAILKYGLRNINGSLIGPHAHQNAEYHPYQHQQTYPAAHSYQSASFSPTSSSSTCIQAQQHTLNRQASLGQIDGKNLTKKEQPFVEGRFGLYHQKIKSFLTSFSSKPQDENNKNVMQRAESTPVLNEHHYQDVSNPSLNQSMQTQTCHAINESLSQQSINHEDESDAYYLRDTCNKWFEGRQNGFPMSVVSSVNKPCMSDSPKLLHNFKSPLYDKVVQKDSIYSSNSTNSEYSRCYSTIEYQNEQRYEIYHNASVNVNDDVDEQSNSCSNSDQHIVVVQSLGENHQPFNVDSNLTVRTEVSTGSVEMQIESTESRTDVNQCSAVTSVKSSELSEQSDNAATNDGNKSSSESGRGTISSSNGNAEKTDLHYANANSSADLTSLDSDQGYPVNVKANSTSPEENEISPSRNMIASNCHTIAKVQRGMQRIIEDGSMHCSDANAIVDDLARSFQSRLSVVNESDSWVSNNTPPPTITTSTPKHKVSVQNSAKEAKYSTIKKNTGMKSTANSSMNSTQQHESAVKSNKEVPTRQKTSKMPSLNKRNAGVYNVPKQKYSLISSGVAASSALGDCDIVSTTTCRDSNLDYHDDGMSSEYTDDTSCWDRDRDDMLTVRKQLQGLENMYSQVLFALGSRMKSNKRNVENVGNHNHRSRRKLYGSVSSIVTGRSSVTSRTNKDYSYYNRNRTAMIDSKSKHKLGDCNQRIKRLESHVTTLAKSVAQLSAEMRTHHSMAQQMESLRRECSWIQEQLRSFKNVSSPGLSKSCRTLHSSNGQISVVGKEWDKFRRDAIGTINSGRVDKLTRFFGDEPPLLKQFMKKLGYEKYIKNLENEKIGIAELPYLTEERMKKIGIPMGPRIKIMQEAQNLLKNITTNQYIYGVV